MATYTPTDRTTLKRLPQRGSHEQETVHAILDAGMVCHVGFAVDGRPVVLPTAYARVDEALYIHGAAASRMLRALKAGVDACVTVTLIDGLVLARSAFHHSMNYRSVVVFGRAEVVEDEATKRVALEALTEKLTPGRWAQVRPPSRGELAGTLVLAIPLTEASAKVRTGPPVDDEADYALPVWAGEIPLTLVAGEPVPDGRVLPGVVGPAMTVGAEI
jgi:uncharacterized protein